MIIKTQDGAGHMDEEKKNELTEEYLLKSERVDYSLNLPETEMDIMLAMWSDSPPYTTAKLMKLIGNEKGWKTPTLISFMSRLEERGYVMSYKNGRERYYIPIAEREPYLNRMTQDFVAKYHGGSLVSFLSSMYYERDFSDKEIDELISWLKSR